MVQLPATVQIFKLILSTAEHVETYALLAPALQALALLQAVESRLAVNSPPATTRQALVSVSRLLTRTPAITYSDSAVSTRYAARSLLVLSIVTVAEELVVMFVRLEHVALSKARPSLVCACKALAALRPMD
jgi:hypothetical protein